MLALYEMLRVARMGVVLIEPTDSPALLPFRVVMLKMIKAVLLRMGLRRLVHNDDTGIFSYADDSFEKVGNYVYCISEREIEKVAMGINLPFVAFKGFHDSYVPGVEFEKFRRAVQSASPSSDGDCGEGASHSNRTESTSLHITGGGHHEDFADSSSAGWAACRRFFGFGSASESAYRQSITGESPDAHA